MMVDETKEMKKMTKLSLGKNVCTDTVSFPSSNMDGEAAAHHQRATVTIFIHP